MKPYGQGQQKRDQKLWSLAEDLAVAAALEMEKNGTPVRSVDWDKFQGDVFCLLTQLV